MKVSSRSLCSSMLHLSLLRTMSRSTVLMMELSLSISATFWSTSCCLSLYCSSSLFTSLRTASRSPTALPHALRSSPSAFSLALVSFCRISISF